MRSAIWFTIKFNKEFASPWALHTTQVISWTRGGRPFWFCSASFLSRG